MVSSHSNLNDKTTYGNLFEKKILFIYYVDNNIRVITNNNFHHKYHCLTLFCEFNEDTQ